MPGFIDDVYLADIGRREGIFDETPGVNIIFQDVDLFAFEFPYNALYTYTLETDTGAYRIDIVPS